MKNNIVAGALVVIAVLVSSFLFKPVVNVTVNPERPFGVAPGNDFTNQVNFSGGVINSRQVATSSQGSVTVAVNEFRDWANGSIVSYAPGLLAGGTLTLPASSTIPSLVPRAGDRQTFCIRNATTTAGVVVTLAGGTGTNLVVASSSASAVGSKVLLTGKVGCITLIRQASTATSFDIDALLTIFN